MAKNDKNKPVITNDVDEFEQGYHTGNGSVTGTTEQTQPSADNVFEEEAGSFTGTNNDGNDFGFYIGDKLYNEGDIRKYLIQSMGPWRQGTRRKTLNQANEFVEDIMRQSRSSKITFDPNTGTFTGFSDPKYNSTGYNKFSLFGKVKGADSAKNIGYSTIGNALRMAAGLPQRNFGRTTSSQTLSYGEPVVKDYVSKYMPKTSTTDITEIDKTFDYSTIWGAGNDFDAYKANEANKGISVQVGKLRQLLNQKRVQLETPNTNWTTTDITKDQFLKNLNDMLLYLNQNQTSQLTLEGIKEKMNDYNLGDVYNNIFFESEPTAQATMVVNKAGGKIKRINKKVKKFDEGGENGNSTVKRKPDYDLAIKNFNEGNDNLFNPGGSNEGLDFHIENKPVKWDTNDYLNLSALAADLIAVGTSMGAHATGDVTPAGIALNVTSLASGLTGTGLSAAADFRDKSTPLWSDLTNLGLGVGLDVATLFVPGAKIGKTATKLSWLIKQAMRAVMGYSAAASGYDIYTLYNKINEEGFENLTGDDYVKLGRTLQTAWGLSRRRTNKNMATKSDPEFGDPHLVGTVNGKPVDFGPAFDFSLKSKDDLTNFIQQTVMQQAGLSPEQAKQFAAKAQKINWGNIWGSPEKVAKQVAGKVTRSHSSVAEVGVKGDKVNPYLAKESAITEYNGLVPKYDYAIETEKKSILNKLNSFYIKDSQGQTVRKPNLSDEEKEIFNDLTKRLERLNFLEKSNSKNFYFFDAKKEPVKTLDDSNIKDQITPTGKLSPIVPENEGIFNPLRPGQGNFKDGGSIVKAQNSTPGGLQYTNLTGVKAGNDWYTYVGIPNRKALMKAVQNGQIQLSDINSMQGWHAGIHSRASANDNDFTAKAYHEDGNNDIADYQTAYSNLPSDEKNFNDVGIANVKFTTAKNPQTGDNKASGWKSDNAYSDETDYRIPIGRKDSYTPEQLKEAVDDWKSIGVDMYLDPTDGYYKLRPIGEPSEADDVISDIKVEQQPTVQDTGAQNGLFNPFHTARWAQLWNTLSTINKYRPPVVAFKQPYEFYSGVYGDLASRQHMENNAAKLESVASTPVSSNSNLNLAAQLSSIVQGNEYRTKGFIADKQNIDQTSKQNEAYAHEATKNRTDIANFNTMHFEDFANKLAEFTNAKLYHRSTAINNFLQETKDLALRDWDQKKEKIYEDLLEQNTLNQNAALIQLAKQKNEYEKQAISITAMKEQATKDGNLELAKKLDADLVNIVNEISDINMHVNEVAAGFYPGRMSHSEALGTAQNTYGIYNTPWYNVTTGYFNNTENRRRQALDRGQVTSNKYGGVVKSKTRQDKERLCNIIEKSKK